MSFHNRSRVFEHRITNPSLFGCVIRYWIEANPGPSYDGIETLSEALGVVNKAEQEMYGRAVEFTNWGIVDSMALAKALIEAIPAANSIEVCNGSGNGTAAHRDWP